MTAHKPTERVLNVLELLSSSDTPLSLAEIAFRTNAPKTTLVPVLRTLTSRNYLQFDARTNTYSLGLMCYLIGGAYQTEMGTMEFIRKHMQQVVEQTNEICQFGIRSDNQVLYVEKVDSKESIRLISHVGKRLPLYCTAIGKALMYNMTIDQIKALFPDGLTAKTPNTITDFHRLEQELLQVNQQKYAYENQEVGLNICCYAVPICINNSAIGAISCSVPFFRDTKDNAERILSSLHMAANAIELYFQQNPSEQTIFHTSSDNSKQ